MNTDTYSDCNPCIISGAGIGAVICGCHSAIITIGLNEFSIISCKTAVCISIFSGFIGGITGGIAGVISCPDKNQE